MATSTNTSLGIILRQARDLKEYPLRTVEEITGISNAYLSQIENNKIKKPSADILHRLAKAYNLDFNYLLHVAGLVEKSSQDNVSFGEFVFSKDNLTSAEQEELVNYLIFMREREKKKK